MHAKSGMFLNTVFSHNHKRIMFCRLMVVLSSTRIINRELKDNMDMVRVYIWGRGEYTQKPSRNTLGLCNISLYFALS
jgi:uncharacterized membrane-anchored protein YitT (DUF2179 family)